MRFEIVYTRANKGRIIIAAKSILAIDETHAKNLFWNWANLEYKVSVVKIKYITEIKDKVYDSEIK